MYIPSYGHPHTLGHKYLIHLFDDPVVIQEKVDGSQISFGVINGNLSVRSRGQDVTNDTTGMFSKAVKELQKRKDFMFEAAIYRGEYLQKPKHNKKTYSRIPKGNVILFDVEYPDGTFANPTTLLLEAHQLDLECVPTFYEGNAIAIQDMLPSYLTNESILGGTRIEGIVIKNYDYKNKFGNIIWAKIVTSEFREKHARTFNNTDNPQECKQMTEIEIVEKYVTSALCEKVKAKVIEECGDWSSKYIPRVLNMVYYDLVNEDCWNFIKEFKQPTINFKTLMSVCYSKTKKVLNF